jgi:hypothetical protein
MSVDQSDLSEAFRRFWRRLSQRGIESHSFAETQHSFPAEELLLQNARAFYRGEEVKNLQSLVTGKIEDIRYLDVGGMQRAVAICACGPTGSILLASYLDGHDDVVMLPLHLSEAIYPFFNRYRALDLQEKLLTYPFFSSAYFTTYFQGDFRITAADYYATVKALFAVCGDWSPDFLQSRRAFFLLLHVVYCVAAGRLPTSPQPLIVYAQHMLDVQLAKYVVEDFPEARFIHTVRDPISNCSRLVEYYIGYRGLMSAGYVISTLTLVDMPHPGMESRTLVIRFEDLHLHTEKTMRGVADWLGLPFRSSLLESTFNGVRWVMRRGPITWSGARPEQANRSSLNCSFTDRCLLFAVLYEDFVACKYPCPTLFKHSSVRVLTCVIGLLIPMKIEMVAARRFFKLSSWRGWRSSIKVLGRLCICRAAIMLLLATELVRRLVFTKAVLGIPEGDNGGTKANGWRLV